jgi:hypothetical protein
MGGAILIVGSLCLLGGEEVDLSRLIAPTVSTIELQASVKSEKGKLIIYSPGHEHTQIHLTAEKTTARLSISKPILCVKATGGPFDFDLAAKPILSIDASRRAAKRRRTMSL